jgi:hypothetical protein
MSIATHICRYHWQLTTTQNNYKIAEQSPQQFEAKHDNGSSHSLSESQSQSQTTTSITNRNDKLP